MVIFQKWTIQNGPIKKWAVFLEKEVIFDKKKDFKCAKIGKMDGYLRFFLHLKYNKEAYKSLIFKFLVRVAGSFSPKVSTVRVLPDVCGVEIVTGADVTNATQF